MHLRYVSKPHNGEPSQAGLIFPSTVNAQNVPSKVFFLLIEPTTDAVPKKRGPKTDVLEALLKRVDGLEAKLKEKNAEGESSKLGESALTEVDDDDDTDAGEPAPKRLATEASKSSDEEGLKIVTDIKPTSR